MPFTIPGRNRLSKEQLDIINLPTNVSWVIEGGPGTGKTVMAFYRASQIEGDSEVPLLVYNRPLRDYLSSAIKDLDINNCQVYTYFQWLDDFYSEYLDKECPYIEKFTQDWEQIKKDIVQYENVYEHIIIDEAQDFPIELIKILSVIAKSVTCFIDPNQTINVGQTDVRSAVKAFRVPTTYKLSRNFRNTIQIRNLAALYCQNGEPPMSFYPGRMPQIIKCPDYPEQTREIIQIIRDNPDKSIGIICGSKSSQNGMYYALKGEFGRRIRIQSTTDGLLNFNTSGVKILNYANMKGLEFDIVILPRIEKIYSARNRSIDINRMYVAASRAVEQLYLFYFDTRVEQSYADVLRPLLAHPEVAEWYEVE